MFAVAGMVLEAWFVCYLCDLIYDDVNLHERVS